MRAVRDEETDVRQQRRGLEQLAGVLTLAVPRLERVEQVQRERGDTTRVRRVLVGELHQVHDAAPPQIL